mgnify:CR=1 FL=1
MNCYELLCEKMNKIFILLTYLICGFLSIGYYQDSTTLVSIKIVEAVLIRLFSFIDIFEISLKCGCMYKQDEKNLSHAQLYENARKLKKFVKFWLIIIRKLAEEEAKKESKEEKELKGIFDSVRTEFKEILKILNK